MVATSEFPTRAHVVVIGGGVIGASLLYHLCELGCTDSVLLEKAELSAGTTWGSSALLTYFTASPLYTRLHLENIETYKKVEAATGQSVGYHETGSLRLAENAARKEEYLRSCAMIRHLGMPAEFVGPDRIRELHPLLNTQGLTGAAFTPNDGYVDPSSVTQALAQAARKAGARIVRGTRVRGLQRLNGGWVVKTDEGTIHGDFVVNAGGMWAPEIGRMVGVYHPVIAFERQYFVTEPVPALRQLARPLPVLRDPEGTFYAREEAGAILVGPYERRPRFWGVDGIPEGFAHESLQGFLDEAKEPVEAALARLPILHKVGIRTVVNVPTSRTPDGNPLVGPVSGVGNYFVAAGFFGGISDSGVCAYLARWILEGEPGINLDMFDPRRYEGYVSKRLSLDRIRPQHIVGLVQRVKHPREEPQGGRLVRASPLYDVQRAAGAVFGVRAGWEVPLWFAPAGTEARDELSFQRTSWFAHVAAECAAATKAVAIIDRTASARIEVSNTGAAALLDLACAADLPEVGYSIESPLLSPQGRIIAIVSVIRLEPEKFYLTTSAVAGALVADWLRRLNASAATIRDVSDGQASIEILGPSAGKLLALLGDSAQWDTAALNSVLETRVGYAPVLAVRASSVTGNSWQLHLPASFLRGLYELLLSVGKAYQPKPIGLRAAEALNLEAGRIDSYNGLSLAEAGLKRLAGAGKMFIGHDRTEATEPARRLVKLLVDAEDADALGGEPVFSGERSVALAVAGGFGFGVGKSLAFAVLPAPLTTPGTSLMIEILGQRRRAVVG